MFSPAATLENKSRRVRAIWTHNVSYLHSVCMIDMTQYEHENLWDFLSEVSLFVMSVTISIIKLEKKKHVPSIL